jgi:Flp pilus assembly pilin Flp
MLKFVKRLMADESGASATEYAVLLAGVGAAAALGVAAFSTQFGLMFGRLVTLMIGWVP